MQNNGKNIGILVVLHIWLRHDVCLTFSFAHLHTLIYSLSLSLSLLFLSFIFIRCILAHCKLVMVASDLFCIFLFPRWMAMIFHASIKEVLEQKRKLIPLSVLHAILLVCVLDWLCFYYLAGDSLGSSYCLCYFER